MSGREEREEDDYPIEPIAKPHLGKQKELEQDLLTWRREKVLRYISRGIPMSQIAKILQVDLRTVYRDKEFMKKHSRRVMQQYLAESIPFEMMKFLTRQNDLSDMSWVEIAKAQRDGDTEKLYKFMRMASDVNTVIMDEVTNNRALVYEARKAGAFNEAVAKIGEEEEEVDRQTIVLKKSDLINKSTNNKKSKNKSNEFPTKNRRARKSEDANRVF